jgi:hypothetical protein
VSAELLAASALSEIVSLDIVALSAKRVVVVNGFAEASGMPRRFLRHVAFFDSATYRCRFVVEARGECY